MDQCFAMFESRYPNAGALIVWEGTVPVVTPQEAAAYLIGRVVDMRGRIGADEIKCVEAVRRRPRTR